MSKLFSEFEPVSSKAFKQKIQFDLKGADYNEILIWHSNEGIDVKPFYHREDMDQNFLSVAMPEKWFVGEAIFIANASQSAKSANKAINNGAEAIYFTADQKFEAKELFDKLEYIEAPLYFNLQFLDVLFYEEIYAFAKAYKINIKLDIIHHLASDGNWFTNLKKDHQAFAEILRGHVKSISIDTTLYQNAGATMVQQLSYGVAQLTEYLHYCSEQECTIDEVVFEVAVGTNYFFEIAKLRAFRVLAQTLFDEFETVTKNAVIKIIAHPSTRNKTIYDYNTNMLRTSTECMSAVLGGADWVVNQPYDALYHKINEFGQRISRNQLIILKEESYFDAVQNAADGSYYIESLTTQLVEKALELFKDIERNGGFLSQLKAGTIQRKIEESASAEQAQFDSGEITLLGTNKHPNILDRMKDELELYPFLKIKPRKTLIAPIIPKRLAENIEKERLKMES
ncbi:methylmalonyl-CoA mutase subunit beta [Dokdonia sp. Hel_I_53]|uniref:methylmalonyl-CoA mutase subunit beta n=1 Tax=Dokdonia sp. Hel_I_53 TaxID=1566287 RepID=UPI00119A8CAB|nr:methylmalonyl-CoA mutase subunit beta [Dokdonia sp. Hel_I_53]TVZ52389.1 heterodimeric methylmalonyl-CoA mutase small subunit [Dokdonia sp. Hel_I_53]